LFLTSDLDVFSSWWFEGTFVLYCEIVRELQVTIGMARFLSTRATYSLPALQKYFSHIQLPSPIAQSLLRNRELQGWSTSSDARGALEVLQKYQLAKIPFANLYLHYSRHHVGTLDPGAIYEYLVESGGIAREGEGGAEVIDGLGRERMGRPEREGRWEGRAPSGGRGGTCTVNNGFFGTVMRSLGMRVKRTAGRVAKGNRGGRKGEFDGWNHLINLVEFEGRRYLVDVGFPVNGRFRWH
jgi:hypothetical protein